MRSFLFILIFILPNGLLAQNLRLDLNYGANGFNDFIGERSLFLGDSSFSLINSRSAGLGFKIFESKKLKFFLGPEFNQLKRIDFESVSDSGGAFKLKFNEKYYFLGLNLTLIKSFRSDKYSAAITLIPFINFAYRFTDCIICENSNAELVQAFVLGKFSIPIQMSAFRILGSGNLKYALGPFLRYSPISFTNRYDFKPFIAGIQFQFTWSKSE